MVAVGAFMTKVLQEPSAPAADVDAVFIWTVLRHVAVLSLPAAFGTAAPPCASGPENLLKLVYGGTHSLTDPGAIEAVYASVLPGRRLRDCLEFDYISNIITNPIPFFLNGVCPAANILSGISWTAMPAGDPPTAPRTTRIATKNEHGVRHAAAVNFTLMAPHLCLPNGPLPKEAVSEIWGLFQRGLDQQPPQPLLGYATITKRIRTWLEIIGAEDVNLIYWIDNLRMWGKNYCHGVIKAVGSRTWALHR
jgi:hypothetical protein